MACYLALVVQAIGSNFLPLLFVFFHESYGISFGNLAFISMTYFITQLVVDFVCATIVDRIGYRPCIIVSEITCIIGLVSLAVLPDVMPSTLAGMIISVIIYGVGSGLIEVLASPIIEACPFENKAVMMSMLHSFYSWGTVGVIILSTAFFACFGVGYWKVMALLWAIVPLFNIYNFATCPIDTLVDEGQSMKMGQLLRMKFFWLFIILMVCAGSAELAMSQWASAFAESALNVSKTAGDLAGPCGFAVCMGISRTLYGKFGEKVDLSIFMLASGIFCLCCYLVAGLASVPIVGLLGCAFCGFAVGIMWPGAISISSKVIPRGGTAMFAMLALSGDLGGALGPALIGNISQRMGDNIQAGLLAGIGFPICLVVCTLAVRRKYRE